eukprot:4539854-Pyramimonas_sp.AAC.1
MASGIPIELEAGGQPSTLVAAGTWNVLGLFLLVDSSSSVETNTHARTCTTYAEHIIPECV